MKKNDFEKMCDRLERCEKRGIKNEIVCAKQYLYGYADGDINKLLKIKAEASSIAYHTFVSTNFGMMALAISCFSLFVGLFKEPQGAVNAAILITVVVLIILLGKVIGSNRNVRKWQNYIIITINEVEKDFIP